MNTDAAWGASAAGTGLTTATILPIVDYAQNRVSFDFADEMEKPDCGIWDRASFLKMKQAVGSAQTIFLNAPVKEGAMMGIGGSLEAVYHNGLIHYWDVFMPTGVGYILNFNRISLSYMKPIGRISGDKAPGAKGDDMGMCDWDTYADPDRRGFKFEAQLDAQFQYSPKHQCKIADFTS